MLRPHAMLLQVSNEGMSYTSRGESTVATSAVTYISSTGHMDPDDASAVGSHMDCASMDMDGTQFTCFTGLGTKVRLLTLRAASQMMLPR